MISLSASTRIFIALEATDMRKGFDGLSGLITSKLKQDPLSGILFLFVNRRRDRMKVLYWDGDGLAIWYRRLEQGTYRLPKAASDVASVEMRSDEFMMLLRGIDLDNVKRHKRYSLAS
jgi:transposase